ncbi:MAG: phenylalanine--tRNA ligase subunit beta, partial [Elusimicrobiota bacterium]
SLKKKGPCFDGVTTGQILKIEKHPNADRLSLCEVNTGSKLFKVVCGAKNIAVGQIVPFASVGAVLTTGVLKKAKIRGIESEGMICSAQELGLEEDSGLNILVLPEDTPVGLDALKLFPKTDYIFEFEMLPNLSHCLSHMGVARELCSFYGIPLKLGTLPTFSQENLKSEIPISIENPQNCMRYTGIVMKNLHAAKTPEWMKTRLMAMDVSPKDNLLIDVSNYVMYELGQPTHCFDLDKLSGPEIIVRTAQKGESLITLENRKLELTTGDLVIADGKKPVALAGIIGEAETAVSDSTKNILIESACFEPVLIRKTSKAFSIQTESSYRFERGTDREITLYAAKRIAQIIKETVKEAGVAFIEDNYPEKYKPRIIEIMPEKINSVLGTNLKDDQILAGLKAVSHDMDENGKPWKFTVPSYRPDIETIWDVSEDVGRFVGYDVIPTATGMGLIKADVTDSFKIISDIRTRLCAIGFSEVYNYDFLSSKELKDCMLDQMECIVLENPISLDYQFLRNSMIPGLLKTLKYNINRGQNSIFIFEIGNVYKKIEARGERQEARGYKEQTFCAGLMFGNFLKKHFWKEQMQKADFYHLKGAMESLFGDFEEFSMERPSGQVPVFLHPEECLELKIKKLPIGSIGRINPVVCANNDFKNNEIFYFEFLIESLVSDSRKHKSISPVSKFPSSWRDLSVVLDSRYRWEEIKKTISDSQPAGLTGVELIDVYRGKNIPENHISVTVRLVFSSMERTLTDKEIDGYINKILANLSKHFNAKLRT